MNRESLDPIKRLEAEYTNLRSRLEDFAAEMGRQINKLLDQQKISLGFPIQSRVKTWESIQAKLERKPRDISSIKELSDLIGLRIVLLFGRDVETVSKLLDDNFHVLEEENTADRLEPNQFGYSSIHFTVEFPLTWLATPTLASLGGLRAEVQVRTVAQHIWAAASHILQYKQESNIPLHTRRAIHRVSALLEVVDLELERVLRERETYLANVQASATTSLLNVDTLANVLKESLPEENRDEVESYADLLEDLEHLGVASQERLLEIINRHREAILADDTESVDAVRGDVNLQEALAEDKERLNRGVFFTHVGLTRAALRYEYGETWDDYWRERTRSTK